MATERLILRVTLRDVHPRVGRRIAVAEDLTLAQLHRVIQEAFDGEDYHLHEFDIEGLKFGRRDYEKARSTLNRRCATSASACTQVRWVRIAR